MEESALITCRELDVVRAGQVLVNASGFSLAAGEQVLITGPSGCGKSALLRTLCLLDPGGEAAVLFKGRPIGHWAATELRTAVSYLPQTPVMIEGSVRDNLCLALSLKVYRDLSFDDELLQQGLDSMALDVSLDADAQQLSPGQKARVSLLQRLILKPDVLLCDEPVAALDEENAVLVAQRLKAASDAGMAQVLVSHQPLNGFQGRHYHCVEHSLELVS